MSHDRLPVSRDGRYSVIETEWDHNGTLQVTVRMKAGEMLHTEKDIRAMRRTARRAISMPEQTRSARMVGTWIQDSAFHAQFYVSRNER